MENNEGLMGDRRFVRRVATAAAVALGASLVPMVWAPSAWAAPTCAGSPMLVTADCVDPTYNQPVIDSATDLTTPVPLHKVSGHFDDSANHDTGTRFNIYLPPKGQWDGRFFQNVYPTQDENASDDNVSFGAASGAYTVQTFTNGSFGYRVDAAAAKFSKTVAASYYGSSERIYGYIWGGSGGS